MPANASIAPYAAAATMKGGGWLSRWMRRLLWLGVISLHCFSVAFYSVAAYIYGHLASTLLVVNLQAFELTIDTKYYPFTEGFHAIFAALHVIMLLEMIIPSLVMRRLIFKVRTSHVPTRFRWLSRVQSMWDFVFGPMGILGVNNPNFETIFALRGLVEVAFQSYQVYKSTQYIARPWLNNVWVIAIAIKCWAFPALSQCARVRHRTQLLLALLVDVVLDSIASVWAPTALGFFYLSAYDMSTTDFKNEKWYDDKWFVGMVNEFQLLVVQSWSDFITRAAFGASLLVCLDDIKILVTSLELRQRTNRGSSWGISRWSRLSVDRLHLIKAIHVITAVWGVVVIALHIEASLHEEIPGCELQLRPWGVTNTSCSYLLIDCGAWHEPIVGRSNELDIAWSGANRKMLSLLNVVNCPDVQIPSSIQGFRQLTLMNFIACNVTAWDSDGALTNRNHPNLRHLGLLWVDFSSFGSSNGSAFPPGLLAVDSPKKLFDIFVLECGWSDLPASLAERWPKRSNLLFPVNSFTTIPETLYRMDPIRINLEANPLATLSARVFEIPSLQALELPATALTELPELPSGLPSTSDLYLLSIQATNISDLPAWMRADAFLRRVNVRAGDTPLCRRLKDGDPAVADLQGRIQC
ncbi:hypothetical protein P43SY_010055 [Pythium insidiosum]|uniref:Uncharacterized protein n=1 Tax=Pythium insidiosum TaxID=114742 RepID=A0AAD5Q855_PYTIN|nr:hypothetical protein P43SY_010055 [Pythium insidiosum]